MLCKYSKFFCEKMNLSIAIIVLLATIIELLEFTRSLEIGCWSLTTSTAYRQSVIRNNIYSVDDPRCIVITKSYLFIATNSRVAFCPSAVLDKPKNRALLVGFELYKFKSFIVIKTLFLILSNFSSLRFPGPGSR